MVSVGALQGVRHHVARRGGLQRRFGARGCVGEVRGWLWPRGPASVATAALGRAHEREIEGRGETACERERAERCVASPGRRREATASRRWRARADVPRPHALCPSGAPRKMTGKVGSGGLLRSWADYSSRPPSTFLFCFISVLFCFLFIHFATDSKFEINSKQAKPSEYFYVAIMDFSRGT